MVQIHPATNGIIGDLEPYEPLVLWLTSRFTAKYFKLAATQFKHLPLVTILSGCEINNFAGQSVKSVCYNFVAMFDLFRLWLGAVLRGFRTRRSLMLENVVLRQQLAVFKRQQPRPRLGAMDKLVRVVARRFWAHTSPATILRKMGFIAGAPQTQRRFGDGEPNELA